MSISLVIFPILSISWTSENFDISERGNPMATKGIDEVLKEHSNTLMSIPDVVGPGHGLCEGKPCIKVFFIRKAPDLYQRIHDTLAGYPVVVEETGKVKPLEETKTKTISQIQSCLQSSSSEKFSPRLLQIQA
jgi:hypothetical protein